jgi:hypothetical protein
MVATYGVGAGDDRELFPVGKVYAFATIHLPDFEPRARLPPAYLSLTCHTVSSILYLTFHL